MSSILFFPRDGIDVVVVRIRLFADGVWLDMCSIVETVREIEQERGSARDGGIPE